MLDIMLAYWRALRDGLSSFGPHFVAALRASIPHGSVIRPLERAARSHHWVLAWTLSLANESETTIRAW